ncbi:MAG: cobalt ABC transporter ATP-binding protein, partial [Candidatus Promineifilaceae bacterium]
LDFATKMEMAGLLKRWLGRGASVLMVTHDAETAARLADRALILEEGELAAEGPAGHVLADAADYRPQIAQLYPGRGWLTARQAAAGLAEARTLRRVPCPD